MEKRGEVLRCACDFLAKREHSREELYRKLIRHCGDTALVEELLDKLAEEDLQSDERFTESFVRSRLGKGQGLLKIRQGLNERGIDQNLISACLESATIDWSVIAEEARAKKFGKALPDDYQAKAKQSRFLYGRGFSHDVIRQILK